MKSQKHALTLVPASRTALHAEVDIAEAHGVAAQAEPLHEQLGDCWQRVDVVNVLQACGWQVVLLHVHAEESSLHRAWVGCLLHTVWQDESAAFHTHHGSCPHDVESALTWHGEALHWPLTGSYVHWPRAPHASGY